MVAVLECAATDKIPKLPPNPLDGEKMSRKLIRK